jgi:ATP-binding protein involved in chromosome partitioning
MVEKNKVSEASVLAALSQVQEPELHQDLVSLNMIRDLKIESGQVSFTIVLTTPACPLKTQIEREAKQAVASLPGVESVQIKMDANIPSDGRERGLLDLPIRNAIAVASERRPCGSLGCRHLWAEYPDHDGHPPPAPAGRQQADPG